jgi:hypothetical protein
MGILEELSSKVREYQDRLRFLMASGIKIDELEQAVCPVLVERGQNESVLIIAFTGRQRALHVPVYEFFETTKVLGYSRILLLDKYGMYYHHGIDRKRPDWPSLIDYLKKEMDQLRPKQVLCVGSSAGGYAAIVAGHHLRVDYVHAFAPQTLIVSGIRGIRHGRFPLSRLRLTVSRRTRRDLFDLASMLRDSNEKTTYFVHYSSGHAIDRGYAEGIAGVSSVVTLGYPCDAHAITVFLGKKGFLGKVLDIANQNRLVDIARLHFGDTVLITGVQSKNIARSVS